MRREAVGVITIHDWQLYSDMKGVGAAARACTKLLRKALHNVRAGDVKAGQEAYHKWVILVAKEGLARWGALDTEPCVQATLEIERILRLPEYSIHR